MTITNLVVKDLGDIVEARFNLGTTHVNMEINKEQIVLHCFMICRIDGYLYCTSEQAILSYIECIFGVESYLKQNLT